MPAPCPYCGKDCGNEYNVNKHKKACYKRPPDRPRPAGGSSASTPASTPGTAPSPVAFPTYRPPAPTPTQTGVAPQGVAGRVVSSGLWKTLASLENAFLVRGRCICTDEQDAAMDANLQAIMGRSGQPVSPWAGFLVGVIGIFFTPLVVEYAPVIKKKIGEWWEKEAKKKEEAKAAHDNRSQPSAAGPQPVG